MEEFLSKQFYGNTVGDWAIALAIIVGSVIFGKLLFFIFSRTLKVFTKKSKTRIDDIIIDMVEEPIVFAIIIAGVWYGIG